MKNSSQHTLLLLFLLLSSCESTTTQGGVSGDAVGAITLTMKSLGEGEKFGITYGRAYGRVQQGLILDALNKPDLDALFVAPVDTNKWMKGTYGARYPADEDIYGYMTVRFANLEGSSIVDAITRSHNSVAAGLTNTEGNLSPVEKLDGESYFYTYTGTDFFGKNSIQTILYIALPGGERIVENVLYYYPSTKTSILESKSYAYPRFVRQIDNICRY